ncbi:MAG TPA: (E)-4-hydroxy-3-methylbut-2-enyl-diphosphate synthase [Fibrobacteria bacterium]|nr:(E)-4-hydroxy-3-methylbut-2-enyl-diphosphate synthase [Fibrobacteria bacterium]
MPYTADRFAPVRRKTLKVRVGNRWIGGDEPILVQSMTTTNTKDIDATVFQTLELAKAGCELVRITTPTQKDSECLGEIMKKVRAAGCDVPVSADIHFQPRAAMEAVKWVEKVRINPGNFVDSKSATPRDYDDASFASGVQKVYDAFVPLVRAAKDRGAALRIGTNHGSLSDRIMWKYGDTIEGMVESALEYLRVCEAEGFDQIIFSMKSSNPRVVVEAYRLLAARLDKEHKPYPFHVGVTEAGDGEDGRLKSSVGIGALLLDGIGDTIRVSLTEDPEHEIPVAKALVKLCDPAGLEASPSLPENLDFYAFRRREVPVLHLGGLAVGGREKIAVGAPDPASESVPKGERRIEWAVTHDSHALRRDMPMVWEPRTVEFAIATRHQLVALASSRLLSGLSDLPANLEIQVEDPAHLDRLPADVFKLPHLYWSCAPSQADAAGGGNPVARYRHLSAWLALKGRPDPIILRGRSDGTPEGNMLLAARFGSLLVDGIGDLAYVSGPAGARACMHLGYDILQAAGVRRTKPEYVACPSCGRTLFDLQSTTQKIRQRTAHLKNISIAIMGCIVNGPGEMADADFGYVGGAPNKVNLYVGRDVVKKNIPENDAPEALVNLIKEHGRWSEPEA